MIISPEQKRARHEYANLSTAVNDAVDNAKRQTENAANNTERKIKRELIIDLLKTNKLSVEEIANTIKVPLSEVIEIKQSLSK